MSFPGTHYSVFARLRNPEQQSRAWDSLVELYWKPVYLYIRVHWNKPNEDAKDLTQAFFLRAMEKSFFNTYDPAKSRFRTFIRTCLDGFVANEQKAASALKRGGSAIFISLDFRAAENEIPEISAEESPERLFEKEWIRNLFTMSLQTLRDNCESQQKLIHFRIFEKYDIDPDPNEPPSYKNLAAEFGISVTEATNYLAWTRREFRRVILDKIRESTASDEEFRNEALAILGVKIT
jgi:RNA polymerase sigma factor (sigma-70 family)